MLDLSAETGSPFDEPESGPAGTIASAREELVSRARQQMGLGG
jgi:hypothetical protein